VFLAALVAVASAQYDGAYPAAPVSGYKPAPYKPAAYKPAEYEGPAEYNFNYDVNAPETYDTKSQSESLKDGYTVGQYSLIDADGLRRTVDYTADDYNGFQATVRREPVGYSAPAYAAPKYQAPAYTAPAYTAPAYKAPAYKAPAYKAPEYPSQTYTAPSYPAKY
jgi:Insect cuticle protein